jgi:phage FluMu protein Com
MESGGYISHPDEEVRCDCGLLLMKLTPEGLEVKCRRCKRVRVLPWQPPRGMTSCKKLKSSRPSAGSS